MGSAPARYCRFSGIASSRGCVLGERCSHVEFCLASRLSFRAGALAGHRRNRGHCSVREPRRRRRQCPGGGYAVEGSRSFR